MKRIDLYETSTWAMLSNRGDGYKCFVAEGTRLDASKKIHTEYCKYLGVSPNHGPSLDPQFIKKLDDIDTSKIKPTDKQEVIECK